MVQLNVLTAVAWENAHGRAGRVSGIIDYTGLPRSTVSRHLAALVEMGLIERKRRGEYLIADSWVAKQLHRAREALRNGWVS